MKKLSLLFSLLSCILMTAQGSDWVLKVSSTVEYRTFRYDKVIVPEEKFLQGATITLFKGSTVVNKWYSDVNGDFTIDVPSNGEYVMEVSYSGCNSKRFMINTMNTGEQGDKFKPSIRIEGVIMSKPLYSIDYTALKQPMTLLAYNAGKKKFMDDQNYTAQTLSSLQNIRQAELDLIDKFNTSVKNGDAALAKNDCPTAKTNYQTAITLLPDQSYPREKLALTEKCLKDTEAKAKAEAEAKAKADAEAKAKAEAEAKAKAEADRKSVV